MNFINAIGFVTLLTFYEVKAGENKNIILVIIDDLRHLTNENVNLCNINNLMANGVNFKNAYAQQALCAPSRNSILTGRRPDSLRLYDFYSYWRDVVGNFTTLPQFFKEKGYKTYSVGKIFHPGKSSNFTDDYPYSWSEYPYHASSEKYKDAPVCKDAVTRRYQKNLVCPVSVKTQPEKSLPDIQSLKYAKRILKMVYRENKPFFLAVGFHKPHIPLKFPRRYLAKVPMSDVKPPRHPSMPKQMPLVAWHPWTDIRRRDDISRLNISFPLGTMPKKWSLKIRQSYYAAALYIDDLIGKLLDSIDKSNTIIVFTSDHGWSMGENGLWAKYSNFDVAVKVPLIISAPGLLPKSINTPVELVDLFPTVVDLAGISQHIPKCLHDGETLCFEGKSLAPLMKSNLKEYEEGYALSQYPRPNVYPANNSDKPRLKDIKIMGYSIKTKRYRYTEWISFNSTLFTKDWNEIFGIELYDHHIDPEEANNLYNNLKYKKIQEQLSLKLKSKVHT